MKKNTSGFSLIEVLVTLIILSVGFLGVASLEILSLKNVNSSYYNYQATLLAYDMEERMRANVKAVKSGEYDNVAVNKNTATYAGAELSKIDISNWADGMREAQIPAISGTIRKNAGQYLINVSWTEQNTQGTNDLADNAVSKNFQLKVKI